MVTACGHLYCWTCLFKWLDSGHSRCPICSASVERTEVTPLYVGHHVRGSHKANVPTRPRSRSPSPARKPPRLSSTPFPSLFALELRSWVLEGEGTRARSSWKLRAWTCAAMVAVFSLFILS